MIKKTARPLPVILECALRAFGDLVQQEHHTRLPAMPHEDDGEPASKASRACFICAKSSPAW
jgi:hypothetical protein